jgi:hypothetical protein
VSACRLHLKARSFLSLSLRGRYLPFLLDVPPHCQLKLYPSSSLCQDITLHLNLPTLNPPSHYAMSHEASQSHPPQPSTNAGLAFFSPGQPIPQTTVLDYPSLQPRLSSLGPLGGAAPHPVLPSVEVAAPANNDATKPTANQQPFAITPRPSHSSSAMSTSNS